MPAKAIQHMDPSIYGISCRKETNSACTFVRISVTRKLCPLSLFIGLTSATHLHPFCWIVAQLVYHIYIYIYIYVCVCASVCVCVCMCVFVCVYSHLHFKGRK